MNEPPNDSDHPDPLSTDEEKKSTDGPVIFLNEAKRAQLQKNFEDWKRTQELFRTTVCYIAPEILIGGKHPHNGELANYYLCRLAEELLTHGKVATFPLSRTIAAEDGGFDPEKFSNQCVYLEQFLTNLKSPESVEPPSSPSQPVAPHNAVTPPKKVQKNIRGLLFKILLPIAGVAGWAGYHAYQKQAELTARFEEQLETEIPKKVLSHMKKVTAELKQILESKILLNAPSLQPVTFKVLSKADLHVPFFGDEVEIVKSNNSDPTYALEFEEMGGEDLSIAKDGQSLLIKAPSGININTYGSDYFLITNLKGEIQITPFLGVQSENKTLTGAPLAHHAVPLPMKEAFVGSADSFFKTLDAYRKLLGQKSELEKDWPSADEAKKLTKSPEFLKRLARGTVEISLKSKHNPQYRMRCKGIIYNPHTLITPKSCFESEFLPDHLQRIYTKDGKISFGPSTGSLPQYKVIKANGENFALMVFSENIFSTQDALPVTHGPLIEGTYFAAHHQDDHSWKWGIDATQLVRYGEEYHSTGHMQADPNRCLFGSCAEEWVVDSETTLGATEKLLFNMKFYPVGDAGAPIVDHKGRVISIIALGQHRRYRGSPQEDYTRGPYLTVEKIEKLLAQKQDF